MCVRVQRSSQAPSPSKPPSILCSYNLDTASSSTFSIPVTWIGESSSEEKKSEQTDILNLLLRMTTFCVSGEIGKFWNILETPFESGCRAWATNHQEIKGWARG